MISNVNGFLEAATFPLATPALEKIPLPQLLRVPFRIIHTLNFCYRSLEDHLYYQEHPQLLLAGLLCHRSYGSDIAMPQVAQVALIARVVVNLMQRAQAVNKQWLRISDIACNTFSTGAYFLQLHCSKLPRADREKSFAITIVTYAPLPIVQVALKVEHLLSEVLQLLILMSTLSRSLLDLLDACVLDKVTEFYAITGIGTNIYKVYQSLLTDSFTLAKEIENNSEIVDALFNYCDIQMKAKNVALLIRDNARRIHKIDQYIGKGTKEVANTVKELGFDFLLLHTGLAPQALLSSRRIPQRYL